MNYDTIKVQETEERVGIITLNRPDKRNALSIEVRNEIIACLEQWADDANIGVVVFTGAGPAFSAGFDLKEFKRTDLADEIFRSSSSYHKAVWHFPRPTIAAINGPAFGGGFDLATLCDMRICGPAAVFGHPEIKFGAPPLYTPLRWIVGCGLARDLCFTGRTIDAEKACRIGLVSEVVSEGEVLDRAISIARTILEAPVPTLEITKKYMVDNEGKDFDYSFNAEHDVGFELFLSSSQREKGN
jgi:enoyl-CoA hydratase/carnithine racemase